MWDKELIGKVSNVLSYSNKDLPKNFMFFRIKRKTGHTEAILCYIPPSKNKEWSKVKIVKEKNNSIMEKSIGIKSYYCTSK